MKRCVIFLPGASPPFRPEEGDVLICADSGYTAARALGLRPDILVGDMDSISKVGLEEARTCGVEVHIFPQDKDRTDGEIALDMALSLSPTSLLLFGGQEGRTDHVLSSFLLLAKVSKGIHTELRSSSSRTVLLRGPESMMFPGDLPVVSLLPLSSSQGVSTEGLKWPLKEEELPLGSTRGAHNEPVSGTFKVSLEQGSLLVIRCPPEK